MDEHLERSGWTFDRVNDGVAVSPRRQRRLRCHLAAVAFSSRRVNPRLGGTEGLELVEDGGEMLVARINERRVVSMAETGDVVGLLAFPS